jgi:hypothetical protein
MVWGQYLVLKSTDLAKCLSICWHISCDLTKPQVLLSLVYMHFKPYSPPCITLLCKKYGVTHDVTFPFSVKLFLTPIIILLFTSLDCLHMIYVCSWTASGILRCFHSIGPTLILPSRDVKSVWYSFSLSFPELLIGISSLVKFLTQIITSFTTVVWIKFGYRPRLNLSKWPNSSADS